MLRKLLLSALLAFSLGAVVPSAHSAGIQVWSNNAVTTLAANANSSTTTLTVASSAAFPALSGGNWFIATLQHLVSGVVTAQEVVKVTAVSGSTWTVLRGQEYTGALAWVSGDTVALLPTAGGLSQFLQTNWPQPVVITPISSGPALTLNPVAGVSTLQVYGPASIDVNGWHAVDIQGSMVTGQSLGLRVRAGTNATDHSFVAQNAAGTVSIFEVAGDSSWGFFTGPFEPTLNSNATGNIFVNELNTLTSGVALTVNGLAGVNNFSQQIKGAATAGQSNGLQIQAGTNSSDFALSVQNQAATYSFLSVAGDSSWSFQRGHLVPTLQGLAAGNILISAPASGTALAVAGAANNKAATFTASTTSGQSLGVLVFGGTNLDDWPLSLYNAAQTANLMTVYGDGHFVLGWNGSINTLTGDASGNAYGPTPPANDNSTKIATTAYVQSSLNTATTLVGSDIAYAVCAFCSFGTGGAAVTGNMPVVGSGAYEFEVTVSMSVGAGVNTIGGAIEVTGGSGTVTASSGSFMQEKIDSSGSTAFALLNAASMTGMAVGNSLTNAVVQRGEFTTSLGVTGVTYYMSTAAGSVTTSGGALKLRRID